MGQPWPYARCGRLASPTAARSVVKNDPAATCRVAGAARAGGRGLWLSRGHLDGSPTWAPTARDRLRVDVVHGQLEGAITYKPCDATQPRIFGGFPGVQFPISPRRLVPVSEGRSVPASRSPA